jgi:hypothetical protein
VVSNTAKYTTPSAAVAAAGGPGQAGAPRVVRGTIAVVAVLTGHTAGSRARPAGHGGPYDGDDRRDCSIPSNALDQPFGLVRGRADAARTRAPARAYGCALSRTSSARRAPAAAGCVADRPAFGSTPERGTRAGGGPAAGVGGHGAAARGGGPRGARERLAARRPQGRGGGTAPRETRAAAALWAAQRSLGSSLGLPHSSTCSVNVAAACLRCTALCWHYGRHHAMRARHGAWPRRSLRP